MAMQTFQRTAADRALGLIFEACEKDRDYAVFDVRDPHAFGHGHLPGAVCLSERAVGEWLAKLPPSQPIFIYCHMGFSSQTFAKRFADAGFTDVHSIDGGFAALAKAFAEARAQAFAEAPAEPLESACACG